MELSVSLYRYNPEQDKFPYMKNYKVKKPEKDIMVLDLLICLRRMMQLFLIDDHAEKVCADLMA